jgi:GxxExxY protein
MVEEEYEYYAKQIFESALEVHRHLGPGLLESAYQAAFEIELSMRAVGFQSQVTIPLIYKGQPTGKN